MWIRLCSVVFVFALLGSGCTSVPSPETFDVSVVNLTTGDATIWETTLVFSVRLQNATPEPILVAGGAHKIYLNGTYVGQGLSNELVEVPRLGTSTQSITVHMKNFTLLRKLLELQQNPTASYRVESTIYSGGVMGRRYRAQKEGSIDLRNLNLPTNSSAQPTIASPRPY